MSHSSAATLFFRRCPEGADRSRALLLQAACAFTGRSAAQLGRLEVGAHGKPYFPACPDLHLSVSHSGTWWLCACADCPVGLDVQIHRSHRDPALLSRRFFHPQEDAFLAREAYRRFFDLWAAKESWVKYTGTGFTVGIGSFSVVLPDGRFPAVEGARLRLLPFAVGYSLCLCTAEPCAVRFLPLPESPAEA